MGGNGMYRHLLWTLNWGVGRQVGCSRLAGWVGRCWRKGRGRCRSSENTARSKLIPGLS